jgi:hypothetical protein
MVVPSARTSACQKEVRSRKRQSKWKPPISSKLALELIHLALKVIDIFF